MLPRPDFQRSPVIPTDFYIALPKIELHAHLSGSISESTFEKILKSDAPMSFQENSIPCDHDCMTSLDGCFRSFQMMHKVLDTADKVKIATCDVIEEFAQDGVIYLELRTSLRPLPTERDYLDAVLHGVHESPSVTQRKIDVKLLLSIDRSRSTEQAQKTVDLLLEYGHKFRDLFVGLDVSGNPMVGSLLDCVPMLELARSNRYKTTVHLAEVQGHDEDWVSLLELHVPDRIGHGTFLPLADVDRPATGYKATQMVRKFLCPLEICLTSNVRSQTVTDYGKHHVNEWIRLGHPVAICTDDKGLFRCTASGELRNLVERCGVPVSQLRGILTDSIRAAFCSESTKTELLEKLSAFYESNCFGVSVV